jgi:HK97 family phage portal protein
MIDALDKAFADADRMVLNCKAVGSSVENVVTASAGFNTHPMSVVTAREQMLHFRGWVWSAVRLIAQRIAGQCVCVGKKPKRARRTKSIGDAVAPLESHPLLDALADPNPWMSYIQLMWVTVASLEITGRGVWWIAKGTRETGDGWGTNIFFIPTAWIIEIDPLQERWKIRPTHSPTDEFTIPGDEILNLHYPSPDGSHPNEVLSPLAKTAEAVLTDQSIQIAQQRAFKNGIFPKVILTAGRLPGAMGVPGERPTFTPQQRVDLLTAIESAYAGAMNNSDKPIILDSLIEKIEKFSQTIMEMDFIGSSKITKGRVLQAYGVSPALLGELEDANRATSTVADEIFVDNKINPLCELISSVLTQKLCPMFAGPNERLVCWIEPAQPHDAENTLKQWDLGLRMGCATRNEYRRVILNLAALPGLDVPLEPAGFLPQEQDDGSGANQDTPEKRLNGHNRLALASH